MEREVKQVEKEERRASLETRKKNKRKEQHLQRRKLGYVFKEVREKGL